MLGVDLRLGRETNANKSSITSIQFGHAADPQHKHVQVYDPPRSRQTCGPIAA